MNLIRLINILRGGLPKSYINLRNFLLNLFFIRQQKISPQRKSKKILLIRPDGIGDFIQWLPCAESMCKHFKSLDCSVTLLGNSAWLSYAEKLKLFDEYIELDRKLFLNSLPYRKKLIEKLNNSSFTKIIHLCSGREFSIGDTLIKYINAPQKIGFKGDLSNDASLWFFISDNWYSKLIDIKNLSVYEPTINAYLLKTLSIPPPKINIPEIHIHQENGFQIEHDDYFILIPGSNMNLKQWCFGNFVKIVRLISDNSSLKCVICGGNKELQIIEQNKEIIDFEFVNLIGKTSLYQLTRLISESKFVLANDTGAVHIAAGLNIPSFCIYGGGHFRRFLPYEETKEKNLPVIIYNEMECFNCNWKCKYQITKNSPAKCIESVTTDQVWEYVMPFLRSLKI